MTEYSEYEDLDVEDERLDWLAALTLRAAIDHDWDDAFDALTTLQAEYGSDGLVASLLLWADTLIEHKGGHGPDRIPIAGIQIETAETGQLGSVGTVATELSWAVQFITARQIFDNANVEALLMVLTQCDTHHAGRYVQALLNITAMTLAKHLETCPVGIGGLHHENNRRRIPPPPAGHTWN